MLLARLCLVPLAVAVTQPGSCSGYPVIDVYEHRPDAPDPVELTTGHGDEYQGVAGRSYTFYARMQWPASSEALEYFWLTDTNRNSSGWQDVPESGLITVDTEPNESWLEFSAGAWLVGTRTVRIVLNSPDAPGIE